MDCGLKVFFKVIKGLKYLSSQNMQIYLKRMKRRTNQHTKIPSQNGVNCSDVMSASDFSFIGIANMNRPIPIITSTTLHKIYENGQTLNQYAVSTIMLM